MLISLLGAFQALLVAAALAFRKGNQPANRVLAALLAAMALFLGDGAYMAADLVVRWPMFLGWSHSMPLLFGPLLYLYAQSVTNAGRRLEIHDIWHFVPALVIIAWSLPVYLLPAAEKVALFQSIRSGEVPAFVMMNRSVAFGCKLVSGVVYTALTVRVILVHNTVIRRQYSTLDTVSLDWLLMLTGASVIVWTIAVGSPLFESAGHLPPGTGGHAIAILMTIATYVIGYRGLHQSAPMRVEDASVPVDIAVDDVTVSPDVSERSERSLLTPGMARALVERLERVMRDSEPWRDADLTLGGLAERVDTTSHRLSEVLNSHIEQTFYDYVNAFRVREVQRQLARPDAASLTLLAIAYAAGFASKSTFNSVFRRHVGMTPSAWRDARGANDGSNVQLDPSGRPSR